MEGRRLVLRRCQNAVGFPRVLILLLLLCIHLMDFVGLKIVCTSPLCTFIINSPCDCMPVYRDHYNIAPATS
ncbi:hypothetical protein BDR03DRAFT_950214 [Suillus americanus]|nr:hypothetical protein BDR03DRAFT_950214 [Suillus americanus]